MWKVTRQLDKSLKDVGAVYTHFFERKQYTHMSQPLFQDEREVPNDRDNLTGKIEESYPECSRMGFISNMLLLLLVIVDLCRYFARHIAYYA